MRFYSGEFAGVHDASIVNANIPETIEEIAGLIEKNFSARS